MNADADFGGRAGLTATKASAPERTVAGESGARLDRHGPFWCPGWRVRVSVCGPGEGARLHAVERYRNRLHIGECRFEITDYCRFEVLGWEI